MSRRASVGPAQHALASRHRRAAPGLRPGHRCERAGPCLALADSGRQELAALLEDKDAWDKKRARLTEELNEAVRRENYSLAATIRDEIDTIRANDPILCLQAELEAAVAREDYALAAQLRDQLEELDPSPTNTSDEITQGVRVKVSSYYVPSRSSPHLGQFFFTYKVQISNESAHTVQVRNRHWVITNSNGRVDEVKGPGVVGEQPILRPGEFFEYTSACPLQTSTGTMEGKYEMLIFDRGSFDMDDADRMEVKIGKFTLNATTEVKSYDCQI